MQADEIPWAPQREAMRKANDLIFKEHGLSRDMPEQIKTMQATIKGLRDQLRRTEAERDQAKGIRVGDLRALLDRYQRAKHTANGDRMVEELIALIDAAEAK